MRICFVVYISRYLLVFATEVTGVSGVGVKVDFITLIQGVDRVAKTLVVPHGRTVKEEESECYRQYLSFLYERPLKRSSLSLIYYVSHLFVSFILDLYLIFSSIPFFSFFYTVSSIFLLFILPSLLSKIRSF